MTAPVIAILDNDPTFLCLLHDLLTDEGYRTLLWRAQEEEDVQVLLRQTPPDLVLVDLWPGTRDAGWIVRERLWDDEETADIPVIVISDEPEMLPVKIARLRAMRGQVLPKPFDLTVLLAAIATVFDPSCIQWSHAARSEHAALP